MTCIAYKHPYIVADQRLTDQNSVILGTSTKILNPIKGLYIGYAGDGGLENQLKEFIINDLRDKVDTDKFDKLKEEVKDNKYSLDLLVVYNSKAYIYDSRLLREEDIYASFYAEGHGYQLALGAMAAGADAWEAVSAATQRDTTCGYPIDGWNVETGQYYKINTISELNRKPASKYYLNLNMEVPKPLQTSPVVTTDDFAQYRDRATMQHELFLTN